MTTSLHRTNGLSPMCPLYGDFTVARKFGGDFNLVVWQLARVQPNLISTKMNMHQTFVVMSFNR